MKASSIILSMVILGEKGPGNDIDVYLQPLIEELKLLWVGVDALSVKVSLCGLPFYGLSMISQHMLTYQDGVPKAV